ncbi:MAG: ABC transporter permease [Acidimicrobiia bacterium]
MAETWRRSRWTTTGLATAGLLLVLLVVVPLFELFRGAIGEGWTSAGSAFRGTGTGTIVVNTLWTGTLATVLAVVVGTSAAFATERAQVPARTSLRLGLLLPLVTPPFVSALSWTQAYGQGGLTDDLWGWSLPGLFGGAGVACVIAVNAAPLVYLIVAAGLATRVAPDLERAARAAGSNGWETFRTVTVPLLRPALLGAAALVFVVSVNSFGIPAVLGSPAGFGTMTTRIYQDLARSAAPAAFARVLVLAAALVVATVTVVAVADRRFGLARSVVRTAGPVGSTGMRGRIAWWPAAALWAYVTVTALVPLVALVLSSVTRAVGLSPVPANWTLANFGEALAGSYGSALGRSLALAALAATAVVLLGGLAASLSRTRGGRSIGTLAILTFAVPGSALAVAVLLAYGPWLRDTLLIILVAYLAKFWALGHRSIAGSADAIPPDLYRAARGAGAGPATAVRTVVIPLLRPAIAAAWAIVFLFAFHELTMSTLLYGPGSETLAVVILNLRQLGDVTVTSAMAVMLTALVLAAFGPVLVFRRLAGGVRR